MGVKFYVSVVTFFFVFWRGTSSNYTNNYLISKLDKYSSVRIGKMGQILAWCKKPKKKSSLGFFLAMTKLHLAFLGHADVWSASSFFYYKADFLLELRPLALI